jgi:hypothetical protein
MNPPEQAVEQEQPTYPTPIEKAVLPRPQTPVTLEEVAALQGQAVEVIEARIQVLKTLRSAAIRATSPEDWLLFRSKGDGAITGYLQDCGCDRIRDLYGIEVFSVSKPERIQMEGNQFSYLIYGAGRCRFTRQTIEGIEGERYSTDDFVLGLQGPQLESYVRKAARANLDGNITRELAGLKSVPLEDLRKAWDGSGKDWNKCRKGRGFGSSAEQAGADVEVADGVKSSEGPPCPQCGGATRFRDAGTTKTGKPYDAFWGCLKYPDCKGTVPHGDFLKSREESETSTDPLISKSQQSYIWKIAREAGWKDDDVRAYFERLSVGSTSEIRTSQYQTILKELRDGTDDGNHAA